MSYPPSRTSQQDMAPREHAKAALMGYTTGSQDAVAWGVAVSVVMLVFSLLVWTFYYKLLFSGSSKKCTIPWYGFGIFLFILSTIWIFVSIGALIASSIKLSEHNNAKSCK